MRVECPSGLVIEARPWSLGDMGEMAIRASQSSTGDELLVNAVARQHVATIDAGPYTFVQTGDVHFDWTKVLKVDVLWALYRIRVASFPTQHVSGPTGEDIVLTGNDYAFPHRCPDTTCDGHKAISVQRVKLSDLKMRKLPASSIAIMRSGASFETKVAGKTVKYVLSTLAQDAPLRDHLKRERRRTNNPRRPSTPAELLAASVTYIEGVNASETDLGARARWIGALGAPDWMPLRDAMTAASPTVTNKVDATCDHCGNVTTGALPLGPGFFAPEDRAEELLEQDGTEEETERADSPTASA